MFVRLGSVCTKIGSGITPRGGSSVYKTEGVALIRSQNVLDFSFSSNGLVFISEDIAENMKSVEVVPGDILLNITGDSVARSCLAPKDKLPARVNQHVMIIRADKTKLNPMYLLLVLQHRKDWLLSQSEVGATRKALTKSLVESLEIDLPDIEHQNKISSIFQNIQQLIRTNERINDYLSDLASEIFNHYIGSIRSKMPFENLISLGSGGTPRTSVSEYWNGQIPFFSPKDVSGCYVYKTEKNITQDGLNNCNSRLYPQNTIIITARGTVGKICLTAKPMAMNQSCYAVLSKNGTVYTTYLLCKYIVKKLKHKASGAVFDAITAQDILKEEIPNIDSTTAIMLESRLSHIFTMILKIGEESARLIQIRDCLLKDLFLSSR